jgi:hypothetical protein
MYCGAASRRACGRAVAAGARAGALAFGCICLRVQSPLRMHRCVYHAHARVCACMRGDFLWLRPVRPHVCPLSRGGRGRTRGGRGPHARAVRGRRISDTTVKALPESLGQCKLLETLCVPRPPPPPCAFAAVPALRCCAWLCRAGAPGRSARRWMRRRRRCRRRPRPSPVHAWLAPPGRPARVGGGPKAARRGRTVGAQGRVQLRARGAAGDGRLAEVEVTVSAAAAALPRPCRRADAWRAGERRAH